MPVLSILDARVHDSDRDGFIRILVSDIIKYIVVDSKTFPCSFTPARKKLLVELPDIPLGDWTTIRLTRNASDHVLSFHSAERVELPGIQTIWHSKQIDFLDLALTKSFTYHVYEATIKSDASSAHEFPSVMIAKFARFPGGIERYTGENEIYSKIERLDIAPRFLGYITENNGIGSRVIGYLLEKIEGRPVTSLADIPLCRSVLEKFHKATGHIHGDAHHRNFMIRLDGSAAVTFDFEFAWEEEEESEEMAEDLELLERIMKEDEQAKLEIGEIRWQEQVLIERMARMAPVSEEEELRRDELGVDEWVMERVREAMREGRFEV
jgi:hypothetical protein